MFLPFIIFITHIYTSTITLGKHYAYNFIPEQNLIQINDNNSTPLSWTLKTVPWVKLIDDVQMISGDNLNSTNITIHSNLGSKIIISIFNILEKILLLQELDDFFLSPTDTHKDQLKKKLDSLIIEMTENTLSKSEMDLIVSKIMDIDSQKITEIIEKKKVLDTQSPHTLLSEFIDILPQEIMAISLHLNLNKSPMIMALEDSPHPINKTFYLTFKINYDDYTIQYKTRLYTTQIKSRKIIEISTKELDKLAFMGIFIIVIFLIFIFAIFSYLFIYLFRCCCTRKKQSTNASTNTHKI